LSAFVAPQQANAIRTANSTDSDCVSVALALRPGENPDLDSDTGLYHFIYERPAPYVGPCYEEMT